MRLLFVHGWGFDAAFWAPLSRLLADLPQVIDDRGYFGEPRPALVDGPCLAVTHSFGTMRVLADPPADLFGLVAINGFERFSAAPGHAGVPVRVLDRMLRRFGEDPRTVLADFRRLCGANAEFGTIDTDVLHGDLIRLRDEYAPVPSIPVVSLQGARDPLLPEAMRAQALAAASPLSIACEGGHLLPIEAPKFCARVVREAIGRMA